MARFTPERAVGYGRRGGQRSHQHLEQQYADLVLTVEAGVQLTQIADEN
jgi:hypothetical protein